VVGDDAVARWCVLSLVRNGAGSIGVLPALRTVDGFEEVLGEVAGLDRVECPCEIADLPGEDWERLAGYDIVLVSGVGDAPRRVLSLLETGIPDGSKLLPAWTFGAKAVIGPLMKRGTSGCWACAALRLGTNGDRGDAADLWSGVVLGGAADPAADLDGPLAGMVGNLLAYEVFRDATGALSAETDGAVIVQDLDSLDARSEPLFPHPACPFCAGAGEDGRGSELLGVAELSAAYRTRPRDEDLLDDPADVLTELETRSKLVQPRAGVFAGFGDEPWNQIPLKIGTVRLGLGHGAMRDISAFDVHHVAGARIRALCVAAAVYMDRVMPVGGVVSGEEARRVRGDSGGSDVVAPGRLGIASGTGVRAADVTEWASATRLGTRETVLVPAAALRPFGPYNHNRMVLATSAGAGAGGSSAEAVARGLLSALSLDAVLEVLRGAASVATVALDALGADPELAFLAKSARNLGVDVELLDLGDRERRPAPVLLARVRRAADGGGEGAGEWAVGSALAWQEAAVGALRDLLGRVQLGRQLGSGRGADVGDPLLGDLDPGVLAPTEEAEPLLDAETGWAEVIERVRSSGGDVLVAPVRAPDLAAGGISAARVLLARAEAEAQ
jgi:bacteriocin biosynthesis cyclodehydratase domain-containing protein